MFLLVAGAVLSGAALMESMQAPDSSERITVDHPDGERLLMTHDSSEDRIGKFELARKK